MRLVPFLLLGAVAAAAPTNIPHYQRIDELHHMYKTRIRELEEQEAFARKPRQERMILRFRRSEPFEGKEIDGTDVVKEVFSWDAFDRETADEAALQVAWLLPEALQARYSGAAEYRSDKKKAVAALLADRLVDKHPHQRKLAILCLKAMYNGTELNYQPDASPPDRSKKRRDWLDFIRRSR